MIRLGLLGCGRIGLAHARALSAVHGARLVAASDAEPERAQQVASEAGARAYPHAEELLASDIDAVIVAAPTYLHAPLAIGAARRGKHVLCEKPMAMTVAEADEMIAVAAGSRVILMVGHNLRFSDHCRAAVTFVREGGLGQPRAFTAERLSGGQGGTWRHWITRAGEGLGAFDALIHDLDLVRWMLGPVERLVAQGIRGPQGTWEDIQTLLTLAGGVRASLEACLYVSATFPFTSSLRVVGDDGTLARRFCGGQSYREAGTDTGLVFYPRAGKPTVLVGPYQEESEGSIPQELAAFVAAVRGESPLTEGRPEDARAALGLVEAIEHSLRDGEAVSIPPERP